MANFRAVTAKDNDLVKLAVKLQSSSRHRSKCGLFIAEGLRILDDCADNGVAFEKLVVSEDFLCKFNDFAVKFSHISHDCIVVPSHIFKKMAGTESPQGVMAFINTPCADDISKIDKNGRYIALENVSDPSNLGAIARTAEALGISGIILSGGCDPYSPKALRASMGTLLRIKVIKPDDLIGFLTGNGLKIYSCVPTGGKPINEIRFTDGTVVLIGNEANGLSDSAISAGIKTTIPMSGRAESLNASVAASIAMWELKR